MLDISIIIPHHNNYEILYDCLKSLYESDLHNAELIIVNNHTTDNSISKIKTKFSKVVIIDSNKIMN